MRFLIASVGATVVTLVLFSIMHAMISEGSSDFKKPDQDWAVQIVRLKVDREAHDIKQDPLKKPIPPKRPPTRKLIGTAKVQTQVLADLKMSLPKMGELQIVGAPSLGRVTESLASSGDITNTVTAVEPGIVMGTGLVSENETVALVKISPRYPRKAARAGIQGWVRVEFTIVEDGSVKDAIVIDAEPNRVFNREAIRAILKWKFKPKIVNGKAVKRRASQKIGFDLSKV